MVLCRSVYMYRIVDRTLQWLCETEYKPSSGLDKLHLILFPLEKSHTYNLKHAESFNSQGCKCFPFF